MAGIDRAGDVRTRSGKRVYKPSLEGLKGVRNPKKTLGNFGSYMRQGNAPKSRENGLRHDLPEPRVPRF
jgi:hypothetical protein